jgi:hypothetical protein
MVQLWGEEQEQEEKVLLEETVHRLLQVQMPASLQPHCFSPDDVALVARAAIDASLPLFASLTPTLPLPLILEGQFLNSKWS